jgi:ABC-type branched-subunit amino acid transport system ATPase component
MMTRAKVGSRIHKRAETGAQALPGTVLRVRDLSKAFGGQSVIENLHVDLRGGEIVLLRGANGAGKTTLLNILTGNLLPDRGTIELSFDGIYECFKFPSPWWSNFNPFSHFSPERISLEGVGRTWQEVRLFAGSDLRNNLMVAKSKQLGENPLISLLRGGAVRQQESNNREDADALLANLGLSGREESSSDRISLGQSKRVAIGRALMAGARILFLDEPLAGLDHAGIRDVLSLLRQVSAERNITLVIVEHVFNIPHILEIATTVWTMKDGRVESQPVAAVKEEGGINICGDCPDDRVGGEFASWKASLASVSQRVESQCLPGGARLTVYGSDESFSNAPVLQLDSLTVKHGSRVVLGGTEPGQTKLNMCVAKGQIAVLEAPNGWGKTTLMQAVAGITPIATGSVKLGDENIESWPVWHRINAGLAFLQSRDNTFSTLSVAESFKLVKAIALPAAVSGLARKRICDLSGGQKQNVAAYCFLEQIFDIGLMDEPFCALDPMAVKQLTEQVLKKSKNTAILIAVPSTVTQPDDNETTDQR